MADAKVIEMETSPVAEDISSKAPTAKEMQEYQRNMKAMRTANQQNLEDFQLEVKHSELQAELVVQRLRAMKAFIDSENLVDDYLAAIEKKKTRDEAVKAKEESLIITP